MRIVKLSYPGTEDWHVILIGKLAISAYKGKGLYFSNTCITKKSRKAYEEMGLPIDKVRTLYAGKFVFSYNKEGTRAHFAACTTIYNLPMHKWLWWKLTGSQPKAFSDIDKLKQEVIHAGFAVIDYGNSFDVIVTQDGPQAEIIRQHNRVNEIAEPYRDCIYCAIGMQGWNTVFISERPHVKDRATSKAKPTVSINMINKNHAIIELRRLVNGLYTIDYTSPSVGMSVYSSMSRRKTLQEFYRIEKMTDDQLNRYILGK